MIRGAQTFTFDGIIEWHDRKGRLQSRAIEQCVHSWNKGATHSPFCLWLSSIQLESPYRAMRPPPSAGVWYSPRMGTPSTTAVSCFNTSKPWKEPKTKTFWIFLVIYVTNNVGKYLGPSGSWQGLFHLLGNVQCCSRRRNTLRWKNSKQAFADVSCTQQLQGGYCICVLLSWSAKLKSPSYRPSLKAIPQTVSRSFRAGTFAPPVSGIHHCLQEMKFIFSTNNRIHLYFPFCKFHQKNIDVTKQSCCLKATRLAKSNFRFSFFVYIVGYWTRKT